MSSWKATGKWNDWRPSSPRHSVPTFVIKATDEFAIQTIRAHIRFCWNDNLFHQVDEETLALAEIISWQRANPDRVHAPDHEHVPQVQYHKDERPHSRACGVRSHAHGSECSKNCPTCHGGRYLHVDDPESGVWADGSPVL